MKSPCFVIHSWILLLLVCLLCSLTWLAIGFLVDCITKCDYNHYEWFNESWGNSRCHSCLLLTECRVPFSYYYFQDAAAGYVFCVFGDTSRPSREKSVGLSHNKERERLPVNLVMRIELDTSCEKIVMIIQVMNLVLVLSLLITIMFMRVSSE